MAGLQAERGVFRLGIGVWKRRDQVARPNQAGTRSARPAEEFGELCRARDGPAKPGRRRRRNRGRGREEGRCVGGRRAGTRRDRRPGDIGRRRSQGTGCRSCEGGSAGGGGQRKRHSRKRPSADTEVRARFRQAKLRQEARGDRVARCEVQCRHRSRGAAVEAAQSRRSSGKRRLERQHRL